MRTTQGETGITDGTVVWTHVADYTTASDMYIVVEDNDLNNATDGNTTGYGSTRSLFIDRSEEHTSELQSLMRISYAVFCLKKKHDTTQQLKNTSNEKQK